MEYLTAQRRSSATPVSFSMCRESPCPSSGHARRMRVREARLVDVVYLNHTRMRDLSAVSTTQSRRTQSCVCIRESDCGRCSQVLGEIETVGDEARYAHMGP